MELNLRNLENALKSVPLTLSTTNSLGRALGVPEYKLIEFSTNYNRDIAYVRTEILRHWLENQQACSWVAIAGALFVIGENQLAEKIRGGPKKTKNKNKRTNDNPIVICKPPMHAFNLLIT